MTAHLKLGSIVYTAVNTVPAISRRPELAGLACVGAILAGIS